MFDVVIGAVVVYGLYCTYSTYGFLSTVLAYFAFRALVNQVPKLWGWTAMNAGDSMWLCDKGEDRMVSLGWSITGKNTFETFANCSKTEYTDWKLQRQVFFFLGKAYWRKEENWSVESHIVHVTDHIKNKEELTKFISSYYLQPLKPGKSPWELCFIENYKDNECVNILKYHHVIADGVAVTSKVTTLNGQKPNYYVSGKVSSKKYWTAMIVSAICCPYYTIKALARKEDRFCLHGPEKTGNILTDWSEPIPLQPIKDYLNKQEHLTINTFLISAMVESIRRYSELHGGCPPEINLSIPMSLTPLPPDASRLPLENNLTFLIWRQRMIADADERLKAINKNMEMLKHSPEPLSNALTLKLLTGVLPHTIAYYVIRDVGKTIAANFTNVPGAREQLNQGSKPCSQFGFVANSAGTIGITLGCYSYNNTLTLINCVDSSITDNPGEFLKIWQEEVTRYTVQLN